MGTMWTLRHGASPRMGHFWLMFQATALLARRRFWAYLRLGNGTAWVQGMRLPWRVHGKLQGRQFWCGVMKGAFTASLGKATTSSCSSLTQRYHTFKQANL